MVILSRFYFNGFLVISVICCHCLFLSHSIKQPVRAYPLNFVRSYGLSCKLATMSPVTGNSIQNKLNPTGNMLTSSKIFMKGINAAGEHAKLLVCIIASSVLLLNNTWMPLYYIGSGIFNSILSKFLKNIIKEPRPKESLSTGYGMPSSHSQSLFYFITIVSLLTFDGRNDILASIFVSSLYIYGLLAIYWRVKSRLHTTAQTIAGGLIGSSFAIGVHHMYNQGHVKSTFFNRDFSTSVPMSARFILGGFSCASGEMKLSLWYNLELTPLRGNIVTTEEYF
eukprot:gene6176-12512_t